MTEPEYGEALQKMLADDLAKKMEKSFVGKGIADVSSKQLMNMLARSLAELRLLPEYELTSVKLDGDLVTVTWTEYRPQYFLPVTFLLEDPVDVDDRRRK